MKTCPISNSTESIEFLNLGKVPLVNNLCDTAQESYDCKKFDLAVQFFPESKLVCLTEVIDKKDLFLNYLYSSGVNKPYLDHCVWMYDYLTRIIALHPGDLVVDVGGNDGSLLKQFRRENNRLRYINVDASVSFKEVNEASGIEYINEFFGSGVQFDQSAQLIVSTNVFQHTIDIRAFVKDIYNNLAGNGIWCLEFPYLLTTLLNDNYDQIYHEHVYYYQLKNIVELLDQEGLKVIDVSFHDMHAGTLRVLSAKKTSWLGMHNSINSFLSLETTITKEFLVEWGKRTQTKIKLFTAFVNRLKSKNKTIIGFGAAAKGCVFLNTVGIDANTIPYIIDDTPYKQGKFVPGTGIQIVDRSILQTMKVDYILILAHNFKDYIIQSLRHQYRGAFIVMFPNVTVL